MILEILTWPTLSMFLVLLGGAVGMVVGAFAPHISRAVYGKLTLASVAVPGLVIIIVSGLLGWVNFYLGNFRCSVTLSFACTSRLCRRLCARWNCSNSSRNCNAVLSKSITRTN